MSKLKTVVQRCYTASQRNQIKKLLGNNLRIARQNAGLSQTQVMASLWGRSASRNRISEIENGHVEIDMFQFLLLIDLYGQSADYVLGRSCEPINDILAAHINNVRLHSKSYLEPIIEQMTAVVIDHIAKIDKDEHLQLIDTSKQLVGYFLQHNQELLSHPELCKLLMILERSVRSISVAEAKKYSQMHAQLEAISERHDREEGHLMMEDLAKPVQYTLPMPEPDIKECIDGAE